MGERPQLSGLVSNGSGRDNQQIRYWTSMAIIKRILSNDFGQGYYYQLIHSYADLHPMAMSGTTWNKIMIQQGHY